MFEPHFTSVVVTSLSNCLSQITVLPDSVPLFLASVFESCSIHHDDEQLTEIAKDLSHAIVRSLSHSVALSPYCDQIVDPALAFLQSQPTAEMLEAILTILMLVNEGQRKHELTQKRFNMLLSIIAAVEKEEPSDATFLTLQNIMNASRNLSVNLMFLIKVPEFAPLAMMAFSRSRRLPVVLKYFLDLAKYSVCNIFSMHRGEIDLLLLKGMQGSFEYRGRQCVFDFDAPDVVKTYVLPLICTILAVHSSYEVDRTLCDLILPNAEGVFSANCGAAIEAINLVFSVLNSNPSPQFGIVGPTSIASFHAVDPATVRGG
jgi:hypothetical protein